MKKLLESDWLRALQFKCYTGAKSVILDYDWLKDIGTFSKAVISRKVITTILCRNVDKSFPK